ncbi:hypothetical protein WJX77_010418 [Trebouxia sp. C0004]
MSSIYNTEPPTKGKVVLHTSFGDLDVELWPKEAPKAVRNFVQLCLEGYYDETVFHRLIKNYILQGGDATGTGTGGESVFGKPFRDEFHSRLRFTHRGLLACAGETTGDAVVSDSNRSQFFITLDATQQLDRKHTIFGKVTGETVFNLTDLSDMEVDEHDVPLTKLVVRDAEVLWNPFDDLQPRVDKEDKKAAKAEAEALQKHRQQKEEAAAKAAIKQKGKRNTKLLSFEEEEEPRQDVLAKSKIRSYHDVVNDKRFIRDDAVEAEALRKAEAIAEAERKRVAASIRGSLTKQQEAKPVSVRASDGADEQASTPSFAEKLRSKAAARRPAVEPQAAPAAKRSRDSESEDDASQEEERPKKHSRAAALASSKAQPAALMTSKRVKVADAELLTKWQLRNKEYKQRHQMNAHREADTMARLLQFRQNLQRPAKEKQPATSSGGATVTSDVAAVRPDTAGAAEPSDAAADKSQPEAAEDEAYAGKVRNDINHDAYKPAAWRVDRYLDGSDDEDIIGSLRDHKLVFSNDKGATDAMARTEKLDDYLVLDPRGQSKQPFKKTLRSDLSGGPLL